MFATGLQRMLAMLPEELHSEASSRYEAHAHTLLDLLKRLYGERDDFGEWFANLMESVGRKYAARPIELKRLDRTRANAPRWFLEQNMLGYSAYVDRLGGTLRGVVERIPHLRDLGVTYLHLLPFLRARAGDNDGGFAVASYDDVQPTLGTMRDLEYLTGKLRKAGISLCSDFVLNHVADDHPWALAAMRGDERLRRYFHVFADRAIPDRYEQTLVQIFPKTAPGNFTYSPAMQGWIWTTFYPYQWDLNYANPEVFLEMATALLRLANRGIEVFRLDSTAFLWKRLGTNGMNQQEAHWLLQAMRCIMEIAAPGVLLKAEAIVPTRELPAYFGAGEAHGRECHIAYHSSLMAAAWASMAEQNTDLLTKVIESTPRLPDQACWLTYVRCHDDIGWNVLRPDVEGDGGDARLASISRFYSGDAPGSFASGAAFQSDGVHAAHGTNGMTAALVGFERAQSPTERLHAQRRMILLYGLAMAFGGLPLIYMGDEFAQGNDYLPATESADGRWLQRPRLDVASYAQRNDVTSHAGAAFSAIRLLSSLRRQQPALAAHAPRSLLKTNNPALLAMKRGDGFLLIANFSDESAAVSLGDLIERDAGARWFDALSERDVDDEVLLESWSMAWLERRC